MFTCGNGSEVSNDGEDVFGGETVDKILSEVAKLKRKCKSLRTLLLETETKRQEEKELYDSTLERISSEYESKLASLKSQFYIELHQTKESRANELGELSVLYNAAQREMSMQGSLIMSLKERLEQASQQFRLPSESAAAEDERKRKSHKTITNLTETIQDLTEKLDCSERERAALQVELQLNREENAHLRDQLLSQSSSSSVDASSVSSPKVGGSPALNRTSGRKAAPFGSPYPRSDSSTSNAEEMARLQAAQSEISKLKSRIGELVRTKEAVEQSVRSVLGDNEALSSALSRAMEQLARRPAAAPVSPTLHADK